MPVYILRRVVRDGTSSEKLFPELNFVLSQCLRDPLRLWSLRMACSSPTT